MSRALVIAGLVVLTAAAHGRTVGFGFVWDDHELIRLNPLVRGERPAADVWTTHLFEGTRPGATGLYRPLAVGSFRATWALWQAPWAFHLTNVLLHVFCVLLLFWLARCLGAGLAAAALGAAAFAVFPPNVEAVAWISGRPDLLLCLGLGLALAATLGGRRWPAWRQAALLGGGLAVALLSKEPAMPAAAALALWLALQREDAGRHRALALMAAALVAGLLLVRGMALDTFLPFVLQPGDQSVGGRLARLGVQLQLLAGFDLSAMVRVPQAGAGRAVAQVVGLEVAAQAGRRVELELRPTPQPANAGPVPPPMPIPDTESQDATTRQPTYAHATRPPRPRRYTRTSRPQCSPAARSRSRGRDRNRGRHQTAGRRPTHLPPSPLL